METSSRRRSGGHAGGGSRREFLELAAPSWPRLAAGHQGLDLPSTSSLLPVISASRRTAGPGRGGAGGGDHFFGHRSGPILASLSSARSTSVA